MGAFTPPSPSASSHKQADTETPRKGHAEATGCLPCAVSTGEIQQSFPLHPEPQWEKLSCKRGQQDLAFCFTLLWALNVKAQLIEKGDTPPPASDHHMPQGKELICSEDMLYRTQFPGLI